MIPSLRKPKRTLRQIQSLYLRKAPTLNKDAKTQIEAQLNALKDAILNKRRREAKTLSLALQKDALALMPKTAFERARDFVSGLVFALVIAVLIRTMWFELYTIPTGSMRPTLKEDDYLIVSKTDYGINVPLQEAHFYFDPTLVKRGSIVVFNGANIDIEDADTTYFYLFPGKKQFVKRLIAKPGDTVYFYGGKLYGIDAAGEAIDFAEANDIEHIPFIRFDGKAETSSLKNGVFTSVLLHQMNQPVAKLFLTPIGTVSGEMLANAAQYSDYLGTKHFAMARLLTKSQLEKIHPEEKLAEAPLYLELTHHPKIQGAQMVRDEYNRFRPELALSYSLIPLQKEHIEAISKHMTSCRFSVQDGRACRLGWNPKELARYLPKLDAPNGVYEIQNGKAYKLPFPNIPFVGLFTNGFTQELTPDHALYNLESVQTLYNLGIELLNQYAPTAKGQRALPSRYAYFKDGDLYLMGAPVILKDDPALLAFHAREQEKASTSTSFKPYLPFADAGAPTRDEILKNGIRVPEKMYLALGDNHAMSADSRHFGFVPEENLKGGVSFLFSPPGPRWGRAPQPAIPHATFPNITVWTAFVLTMIGSSLYYRKKLREPIHGAKTSSSSTKTVDL